MTTRVSPHTIRSLIEHGSSSHLLKKPQNRRFNQVWDSLVETYIQANWTKFPGRRSPGYLLECKLEARQVRPLSPDEANLLLLSLIQAENQQKTSETGS